MTRLERACAEMTRTHRGCDCTTCKAAAAHRAMSRGMNDLMADDEIRYLERVAQLERGRRAKFARDMRDWPVHEGNAVPHLGYRDQEGRKAQAFGQ